MGCSCGSSTKTTAPKHKFIARKAPYTILNVIADEFLNKAEKVSKYVRAKRLLRCYACDEIFNPTKQCKKCGCFVSAKVMYKKSSCPKGKW